ncbi:MAG: protease complex subunit PrcB family protein [Limnohabitans sp.]|nr:protease complex subunit PrcB family protein [Limnohabitans sp.]
MVDVSNIYEVIYKNDYSGAETRSFKVIRNLEDFKAYYQGLNDEKIPDVDFKKSMVVILNMGMKNTGGYSIEPDKLFQDGDRLVMTIKENSAQKDELVTMALTKPVCIVKINSKKKIIVKQ